MKKSEQPQAEDEMRPEYDFAGKKGVRGKYHQAYRQGHTVRVQETDGTVSVYTFTLEDGAVIFEPGVREFIPPSDSANQIF